LRIMRELWAAFTRFKWRWSWRPGFFLNFDPRSDPLLFYNPLFYLSLTSAGVHRAPPIREIPKTVAWHRDSARGRVASFLWWEVFSFSANSGLSDKSRSCLTLHARALPSRFIAAKPVQRTRPSSIAWGPSSHPPKASEHGRSAFLAKSLFFPASPLSVDEATKVPNLTKPRRPSFPPMRLGLSEYSLPAVSPGWFLNHPFRTAMVRFLKS